MPADPATAEQAAAIAAELAPLLRVPLLLTATGAAAYLGFGLTKFYGLADEPGFPRPVKVPGRSPGKVAKRYRRSDLEAWAAARPPARRTPSREE